MTALTAAQATLFEMATVQRTEASWTEFINAMESGDVYEIDAPLYDHWLDVLPPDAMYVRRVFRGNVVRRVDFVFREGDGPKVGFWSDGEHFFMQRIHEETP